MTLRIHCDNKGCDMDTFEDTPGVGWRRSEPLGDVRMLQQEYQTQHFCSFKCEAQAMTLAAEKYR